MPSGSKLWRQAYRYAGKQRTAAHGVYPQVSISEARARRDDAKRLLRQGQDPGAVVKAEKAAEVAKANSSFSTVGAEWKQRKIVAEKKSASTLAKTEWLLGILNDGIGSRPVAEIEAPEVLDLLRQVEAQGKHEAVKLLRATASRVFRFGIASGHCKRDPAADLRGALTAVVSTPRAAITDANGVGALLRAIESLEGRPVVRLALQFLALVFVRPGEACSAEWGEIEGNVWNIPGAKMKMREPHRVPLSRQALAVLDKLRPITGNHRHLFASLLKRGQPIATNRLNAALREAGFASDEVSAHGFRAMASTILNESGKWSPDVIELQLAHQERNKVRAAYNRARRWPERFEMMQWYADYLDGLRDRGEVVALPRKPTRRKS
jgi:integrase